MRPFHRFIHDERAILLKGIVAISVLIASSITWLVCAMILSRTTDALTVYLIDPRALTLSSTNLMVFSFIIIIIDVGILVWWAIPSRETQEEQTALLY